jgi:CitMHS family citrate-Mg2+:H+ or citrate-Ca2+:H+ symporter
MIFLCIALIVNYQCIDLQKTLIMHHAGGVLTVVSIVFSAGIFTGVLSGTGMVDAMSKDLLAIIPTSLGPYLAPLTALLQIG